MGSKKEQDGERGEGTPEGQRDREGGIKSEGWGAGKGEAEKETESQRATGPRRKKLRDRELDRESQRKKKYQQATGQRGRNEKIRIWSWAEREGDMRNSQGQQGGEREEGKNRDPEPDRETAKENYSDGLQGGEGGMKR